MSAVNHSSLRVDDLVKDFAGLRAVDLVSLSVQSGEILGRSDPKNPGKQLDDQSHHRFAKNHILWFCFRAGSEYYRLAAISHCPDWTCPLAFQVVRLFRDFSVERRGLARIAATGMSRREERVAAEAALSLTGMEHRAFVPSGEFCLREKSDE